jgi:hypothetical protein
MFVDFRMSEFHILKYCILFELGVRDIFILKKSQKTYENFNKKYKCIVHKIIYNLVKLEM